MGNIMKKQKGIEDTEQAMKQAIEAGKKQTKVAEPTQAEETPKKEKAGNKANTKPQKGVMGFRAELGKIEVWKLYAEAAGLEIGAMCTAAIDEYMQSHKLTGSQKKIFDLKTRTLAEEKRIKGE